MSSSSPLFHCGYGADHLQTSFLSPPRSATYPTPNQHYHVSRTRCYTQRTRCVVPCHKSDARYCRRRTQPNNPPQLALFKIRMHPLIVHGILSSRHLSNRIPKNPTVLFTDASTESGDSSVRSKMVAIFTYCLLTISSIVIAGRQDSSFWIIVEKIAGITIRWSTGRHESP